jgi:hypothetical protein
MLLQFKLSPFGCVPDLFSIGDSRALEAIEHAVSDSNKVVAKMAQTVIAQLK